MKLRSAPLDDVFQELQFALDQDGGSLARAVGWLFVRAYRWLKAAILLALGCKWRTGQQSYPESGCEPFDITPEELGREWGQR